MRTTIAFLCVAAALAQDKDQLRRDLRDTDLAGTWIYDDLERSEERRVGKECRL